MPTPSDEGGVGAVPTVVSPTVAPAPAAPMATATGVPATVPPTTASGAASELDEPLEPSLPLLFGESLLCEGVVGVELELDAGPVSPPLDEPRAMSPTLLVPLAVLAARPAEVPLVAPRNVGTDTVEAGHGGT